MRHDRVEQSEAAQATAEKPWWHSATIYEIALISFQDSNGDGKGDLAGLLSRVDYLKWLGVDAVWLTPIYRSPFRDLGYDISDYCSIDPAFGTLDDFDLLLGRLHDAEIRFILDLVPNHTANTMPGSSKAAALATTRRQIGTSGLIRPRMGVRPTIG
ncbi:glycosidase [Bradyrhizobium sp. RT4b]